MMTFRLPRLRVAPVVWSAAVGASDEARELGGVVDYVRIQIGR